MSMRKTRTAVQTTLTRRSALSLAITGGAAGLLGTSNSASAATWPSKTVRVVTFGPPGAAPDLAARLWSGKLSAIWNQPVIIDNRPGGDGIIAVQAMLAAKDGHTVFFGPHFIYSVLHNTNSDIAIRPRDEMLPIIATNLDFIGMAVSPKSPVSNLSELREYARNRPGQVTWWAPSGSSLWLLMQDFIGTAGLKMLYVPYSGAPKAAADLAEDRLHVVMMPLAGMLGLAADNRVRLIATTGTQRPVTAPAIQTAREQGFPGLTIDGVFGFYAPKGTPADVMKAMSMAVASAGAEPGFDAQFSRLGQSLRVLQTPEFMTELIGYEERFAKLAATYKR